MCHLGTLLSVDIPQSPSQMLFVKVLCFRLELNAKTQLQQERNCGIFKVITVAKRCSAQATEKADPMNKINSKELEHQKRTCKEHRELHSSCFQAHLYQQCEEQHQELLN